MWGGSRRRDHYVRRRARTKNCGQAQVIAGKGRAQCQPGLQYYKILFKRELAFVSVQTLVPGWQLWWWRNGVRRSYCKLHHHTHSSPPFSTGVIFFNVSSLCLGKWTWATHMQGTCLSSTSTWAARRALTRRLKFFHMSAFPMTVMVTVGNACWGSSCIGLS